MKPQCRTQGSSSVLFDFRIILFDRFCHRNSELAESQAERLSRQAEDFGRMMLTAVGEPQDRRQDNPVKFDERFGVQIGAAGFEAALDEILEIDSFFG